jgi:hypothetical protein
VVVTLRWRTTATDAPQMLAQVSSALHSAGVTPPDAIEARRA